MNRLVKKYLECQSIDETAYEYQVGNTAVYQALKSAGVAVIKRKQQWINGKGEGLDKPRISMKKEDSQFKQLWDSILSTKPMRIV